jgi:3-phosphoshikimate 1-carboxyvinyltransferase
MLHIEPAAPLQAEVTVPGDKSVTHRSLLLAALCRGTTRILGAGQGEDNLATAGALRALGTRITIGEDGILQVEAQGLRPCDEPLDCMNSGTTARLLTGVLAGLGVRATLVGDASLSRRPMRRVADPLRDLGFGVETIDGRLPLHIRAEGGEDSPAGRQPVRVELRVASAQVKSAILLACWLRNRPVELVEPAVSRDHTERLLRALGVRCESSRHYADPLGHAERDTLPWVRIHGNQGAPAGRMLEVPGDISSAAFWWAAGLLTGGEVTVRGVGINPTRAALLRVLSDMGARVKLRNRRVLSTQEPVADVTVSAPEGLRAVTLEGAVIPLIIDEIPLLCLLGAAARGRMVVRDAEELRHKESDRVTSTAALLHAVGVKAEECPDGLAFEGLGRAEWPGPAVMAHGDHRLAMAGVVACMAASSPGTVDDPACMAVSYPGFLEALRGFGVKWTEERGRA